MGKFFYIMVKIATNAYCDFVSCWNYDMDVTAWTVFINKLSSNDILRSINKKQRRQRNYSKHLY